MSLSKYEIDFQTVICGIPCGIAITSYYAGTNYPITSYSLEPNDEPEVEFVITDRKGYEANWLSKKASRSDMNDIEAEVFEFIRTNKENF